MSNTNSLVERSSIDSEFKWALNDMFEDVSAWENTLHSLAELVPHIKAFKGKIFSSSSSTLNCLKLRDQLLLLCDKLFAYARMKRDEDNTCSLYQQLTDKAIGAITKVDSELAFIAPEIANVNLATVESFIKDCPELEVYAHFLKEIIRQKEHVLSEKEETIMAMYNEIAESPSEIFTMLNDADIQFPLIKDEQGNLIELTKGNYYTFMQNPNRNVRENAFKALYSTYSKTQNSFAKILSSSIKADSTTSLLRKYNSSLEASLDKDNISLEVYNKLIDTVNKNLPLLHEYLDIRKKVLKLDKLHMYDLSVPLVSSPNKHIPYSDALSTVLDGLAPMGNQYCNYLKQGFSSNWVDVYESKGKTSGAYSWGVYSVHPYVLLNYQGNLNDVLTIAHEMGHALHSFYTNQTQHYVNSHYKIFVAEVASTTNEILVIKHLLNNTKNSQEKAYLLNHFIDEFRSTLFRQTMFAEFEKIVHSEIDNGGVLSLKQFQEIYLSLNSKYFGPNVEIDQQITMEWARIPHFYNSFYVYKYATGFSCATSLANQILTEKKPAIDRYIKFLSSGNSDYPIELLKRAGVDLSTPKPVQDALDVFKDLILQLADII